MLKYALLGFLNYRPMSGYDLKQFMDQSTANFWHAKLSQIYITLKALEEDGLVTSSPVAQESRPDRRVYTITAQGQTDLTKWINTPEFEIAPSKEPFLLKLFFSAQLSKESLLAQLRIQRDLHQKQIDQYQTETADLIKQTTERAPHLLKDALLWNATRRSGEIIEEAIVRWLDETIEMINKEFSA